MKPLALARHSLLTFEPAPPRTRLWWADMIGTVALIAVAGLLGMTQQPSIWLVALLGFMYSAISLFPLALTTRISIDFPPIAVVAALLTLDLAAALWVVVLGAALSTLIRWLRQNLLHEAPYEGPVDSHATIITALGAHGLALLAAWGVYRLTGGDIPLTRIRPETLVPLALLLVVYGGVLQGIAMGRMRVLSGSCPLELGKRHIGAALVARLIPLPLGVLVALAYHGDDDSLVNFLIVVIGIMSGIWLIQSAVRTRYLFERRVNELASLNRIGRAIAANLSLDDLLATIYAQVQTLCDLTTFYIALYDADQDAITFPFVARDGELLTWEGRRMGNGLTEHIIRTRRTLLIPDRMADHVAELGAEVVAMMPACFLGVPLVAYNHVMGVLAVHHAEREHAYSQADADLLTTVAAQAAIAIRNAGLFQQARVARDDLADLVETARQFTASLDLETVVPTIVDRLQVVTPACEVSLFRWEGEHHALHALAHTSPATAERSSRLMTEQFDLLNRVIQSHESALFMLDGQEYECPQVLLAPLAMQERPVGLIALWHDAHHMWTPRERQIVAGIAHQAAAALHNAITYTLTDARLRTRIIELSAIEVITRRMSATLDLRTVINDVLAAIISTIDANVGNCALVMGPDQFSLVAHLDVQGEPLAASFTGLISSQGVVGRTLRTRRPMIVPDTALDPDYIQIVKGMRSELCVPIMREGQPIGVLNFESVRPNAFNETQARFVSTLAEHVAIAIENARLFYDRRRQIETLVGLRTLALELLTALSLDAVVEAAAARAQKITQARQIWVYVWDSDQEVLELAATRARDGTHLRETLPDQDEVEQVARSDQSYFSVDVTALPAYHIFAPNPDFNAQARIPIRGSGRVLGVLAATIDDQRYYTLNEIQALDVLANQVAVAIENTQLYEQIRAGRDRLQAILDSTHEGMLLFDSDGRLLKANAAAEAMLEQDSAPYVGLHLTRWIFANRDKVQHLGGFSLSQLRQYLAGVRQHPDKPTHRQFQQRRRDGTCYIDETGTPVLDERGQPVGWLLVWRDITEERELEQVRQELSNMIVHDLRSPLTAILSSLTMIQDLLDEGESDLDLYGEIIRIGQNSGEHMLNLVQSLLDIARLEQGTLGLSRDAHSLRDVIEEAIGTLSSLAYGAEIHITTDMDASLPPTWIDADKIKRVIGNLLDNALRYTPMDGTVTVRARYQVGEPHVTVCIEDTGPGIPPDARLRIFDKFTQLDQSIVRGHKGSGLGLAFCKMAVEAHGGHIWVDDAPGGGAIFCLTLPIFDEEAANHAD